VELGDLDADPILAFGGWLADAVAAGLPEPTAMTLATADADGVPSARTVLLKGHDERGFVFHTNRDSHKGRDLAANPRAACVFLWRPLDRQVVIAGRVEPVSDEESDAYFRTRPRVRQLGAWASRQSSVLASRAALDERLAEVAARFGDGEVPRPPYWGGYRVVPFTIEFWHAHPKRLHDRLRFRRTAAGWAPERLSP
jgi:pyridoxamine 5'-phosphate oxidase